MKAYVYSQLLSVGHDEAVWSGDSDLVTNGGIWKRPSDRRREVESQEAQGGGEVDHFHGLKEWKMKDCGCQKVCVSNEQVNSIFLSEGDLQDRSASKAGGTGEVWTDPRNEEGRKSIRLEKGKEGRWGRGKERRARTEDERTTTARVFIRGADSP